MRSGGLVKARLALDANRSVDAFSKRNSRRRLLLGG